MLARSATSSRRNPEIRREDGAAGSASPSLPTPLLRQRKANGRAGGSPGAGGVAGPGGTGGTGGPGGFFCFGANGPNGAVRLPIQELLADARHDRLKPTRTPSPRVGLGPNARLAHRAVRRPSRRGGRRRFRRPIPPAKPSGG